MSESEGERKEKEKDQKDGGRASETGEGEDALGDFIVRFRSALLSTLIVEGEGERTLRHVTVWFSRAKQLADAEDSGHSGYLVSDHIRLHALHDRH